MERKRLLLPGFISPALCEELVFIHKSCGVVGYRPHVLSTTLSHLVATNSAALILPFIALRERVREAVEECFGCEFELFLEFTGLISWMPGASIGWHSDDNRDYLRQRHFSAVCYLNTYEQDFHGGLFHFQNGQPDTVIPVAGTILIYSANGENIHSVDEVVDGERITMAFWFTRDLAHDEDKKLIDQLMNHAMPLLREQRDDDEPACDSHMNLGSFRHSCVVAPRPSTQEKEGPDADEDVTSTELRFQSAPSNAVLREHCLIPVPASTNMYWVHEAVPTPRHDVGFEATNELVVSGRDQNQGFDVRVMRLATLGFRCVAQLDDPDSILEKPTSLTFNYHHQHVAYEFANLLHALQVVQFHEWRTSSAPMRRVKNLHYDVEETMVKPWKEYVHTLTNDLLQMLPAWQNTGSLFIRQES